MALKKTFDPPVRLSARLPGWSRLHELTASHGLHEDLESFVAAEVARRLASSTHVSSPFQALEPVSTRSPDEPVVPYLIRLRLETSERFDRLLATQLESIVANDRKVATALWDSSIDAVGMLTRIGAAVDAARDAVRDDGDIFGVVLNKLEGCAAGPEGLAASHADIVTGVVVAALVDQGFRPSDDERATIERRLRVGDIGGAEDAVRALIRGKKLIQEAERPLEEPVDENGRGVGDNLSSTISAVACDAIIDAFKPTSPSTPADIPSPLGYTLPDPSPDNPPTPRPGPDRRFRRSSRLPNALFRLTDHWNWDEADQVSALAGDLFRASGDDPKGWGPAWVHGFLTKDPKVKGYVLRLLLETVEDDEEDDADNQDGDAAAGLQNLNDAAPPAAPAAFDVFVSYSSRGSGVTVAREVTSALRSSGFKVWIDEEQMSDHVTLAMSDGIESSKLFVAVTSKEYQESQNCMDEIRFARNVKAVDAVIHVSTGFPLSLELNFIIGNKFYFRFPEDKDRFLTEVADKIHRNSVETNQ